MAPHDILMFIAPFIAQACDALGLRTYTQSALGPGLLTERALIEAVDSPKSLRKYSGAF